jgi:hypothetical protein
MATIVFPFSEFCFVDLYVNSFAINKHLFELMWVWNQLPKARKSWWPYLESDLWLFGRDLWALLQAISMPKWAFRWLSVWCLRRRSHEASIHFFTAPFSASPRLMNTTEEIIPAILAFCRFDDDIMVHQVFKRILFVFKNLFKML